MHDFPTKALSIMQPWAWLIVNGHKDIENRTWRAHFRGPVMVHAGKKIDKEPMNDLLAGIHPVTGEDLNIPTPTTAEFLDMCGGIVGTCEIVDSVTESGSEWFVGPHGFLIRNGCPLPFRPCKGALGFFKPTFQDAPAQPQHSHDLFKSEPTHG